MSDTEAVRSDEVTRAVQAAKDFLLHAFKDEKIENLSLEEVKHDRGGQWDITLGFSRRSEVPLSMTNSFLQAAAAAARSQRAYKVVKVDLDGPRGLSITNRRDD